MMSSRYALLCCILAAVCWPGTASAKSAEELNEAGKARFGEGNYDAALINFEAAARLRPEGKYFFNVCFTLTQLSRLEEALAACAKVEPNGASDQLKVKNRELMEKLRERLGQTQGSNPSNPSTGTTEPIVDGHEGGTNTVDQSPGANPSPTSQPASGQLPGLTTSAQPPQTYNWSLGVELAALANLGIGGDVGSESRYAGSGFQLRVFADFMLWDARKVGAQGYIAATNLASSSGLDDRALSIYDIGGGLFVELDLTKKLSVAPMAGAHFAILQPRFSQNALVTVGGRAEVSLAYAAGASGRHVFTLTPAINVYAKSVDTTTLSAAELGLDRASASFTVGVGYTHRFMTPFGSTPIFTLE